MELFLKRRENKVEKARKEFKKNPMLPHQKTQTNQILQKDLYLHSLDFSVLKKLLLKKKIQI